MKTLVLAWRLLLRDWKAGELTVFSIALIIAVTAVTAVGFLTDRVGHAVDLRAAESLAADLRLGSSQPLPEAYLLMAQQGRLETATQVTLPSVVFHGEHNTLAAISAVAGGYPLRGTLKTAQRLLGPVEETQGIPASGEAWATARLLAQLDADTGTLIKVGSRDLKITRVLAFRPDEGWRFVDLAPTLLINRSDLPATGLIQPGSRVSYRQLFAGPRWAVAPFKAELQTRLTAGEQLDDIKDTNPQIRSAMDRSRRFLNLASLLSVLLAAIAIAMASRRYACRHRDRVALLKCLGTQQSFIFKLSLTQLFLLSLVTAAAGILLGFLSQQALAFIARDLIAQTLPPATATPVLLGFMTALLILCGFSLPDQVQMGRTPVLRVLRKDINPAPLGYGVGYSTGIVALLALLQWLLGDFKLVVAIAVGASTTFAVLGFAAWLLVRLSTRFRGAAGVSWRYGLASLSRHGRESIVQIVAFGLGLMVLMLLTLVRNNLMDSWHNTLPSDAPNQFMINIQPFEVPLLQQFFTSQDMPVPRFVPLVRARMTAINGKDVGQITFEDPQGERWARRESNLSFTDEMQAGNQLTKGEWWTPGTLDHEVSIESVFGQELGVKIGDELSFDVAGEPVNARVTSFRSVEWDTFKPNFFMQFSPATLAEFPATYISSMYVPAADASKVMSLMRAYPSVTVIDLEAMLVQVRDVMDKASLAVEAVFLFTLFAGLAVLWAAAQSNQDERRFESAILRTLGASRRRVLTGVATEFIVIGLLAGILASAGASLAAWYLADQVLDLPYHFSPLLLIAGPVLGMLFVGMSGVLATRSVVSHAPLGILQAN